MEKPAGEAVGAYPVHYNTHLLPVRLDSGLDASPPPVAPLPIILLFLFCAPLDLFANCVDCTGPEPVLRPFGDGSVPAEMSTMAELLLPPSTPLPRLPVVPSVGDDDVEVVDCSTSASSSSTPPASA